MRNNRSIDQPDETRSNTKKASFALVKSERLPQSRSVHTIKQSLLPIVEKASEIVIDYTLFENPFPTPHDLSGWISEAWTEAFDGTFQRFEECNAVCRRQVCRTPTTVSAKIPVTPEEE